MSWEPIAWGSLTDRPPVQPTIGGLVYPGRRHVFSGPPESLKTWAALCLALDHVRDGGVVLHVDFEMFAYETRDRLRDLGASDEVLESFLHVEPDLAATEGTVAGLVERWRPTFAIIDAAAGAYDLQGLDDNKRRDVEVFSRAILEPLRVGDVATVLIDHVTKNAETRGRFSIGSERKVGGADVHLGFEPVVPFGRGRNGLVRIVTHKDRFGYLPRPRAAELELRSEPDTGKVTWEFRPAGGREEASDWKPTVLMEKVSRFLEDQACPVSRNVVEQNVTGKAKYVRDAVAALITDGYATETPGPRGSPLLLSVQALRHDDLVPTSSRPISAHLVPSSSPATPHDNTANATSSHLVPTSSPRRDEVPRPSSPPLQGEDEDEVVSQAEIERIANKLRQAK